MPLPARSASRRRTQRRSARTHPPTAALPAEHAIYRVPLGSGVVRARKVRGRLLLAQGCVGLPLLAAVVAQGADDATPSPTSKEQLRHIEIICRAALVDPAIALNDIPFSDRMALYRWATSAALGKAVWESSAPWAPRDLEPLLLGETAMLIDRACERYHMRPSALFGLDADLAADFDVALAYRGLRQQQGDGEVEVEDVWGNMHRVPASALPDVPSGAKVTNADAYAKRMERLGMREMTVSAGGGEGAFASEGVGGIGAHNRFRQ